MDQKRRQRIRDLYVLVIERDGVRFRVDQRRCEEDRSETKDDLKECGSHSCGGGGGGKRENGRLGCLSTVERVK